MALLQSCRQLSERSWRSVLPVVAEMWSGSSWDQSISSFTGPSACQGRSMAAGQEHQAVGLPPSPWSSQHQPCSSRQQQQWQTGVGNRRWFSTARGQPSPDVPAQAGTAQQEDLASTSSDQPPDAIKSELLGILSQPLPLGSTRNSALNDLVIEMGGSYFLDPQKTLQSTMRAFLVIKQVLRSNGHVCIVNSNPTFTPLMRYAAQHCLNSNIWWDWDPYTPGSLLKHPACLMSAGAQPARGIMAAKGLALTNVHCPEQGVMERPMPQLPTLDKWRLWNTGRTTATGLRGRALLRRVVAAETQAAQLLLPGAGNQLHAPTLIVILDLSHGHELVTDAHEAGIMTASVVNAHNELDRITYPIYAAEAHPAYTHFFLNWLLKIVNVPPPPLPQPVE